MENGKNLGERRTPNEAGKSLQRVRVCRHPHDGQTNVHVKKNRTNIRHANWLKQSQSPSPGPSHSHQNHKAFQTPKRSKLRRSGCSHGDSPDTVQDIIWEPASPPAVWNVKGSKKSGATEISDIVNRIAPKEGSPDVQESPVLEWIEEGAIRCTPDVPTPRPRRTSTRQNSVEDLKKLAREFDLRINKEQQDMGLDSHPASLQRTGEGEQTGQAGLDAELNALFDAPTQHLSHRLSQSSSTSSQEVKASLASAVVDRGDSGPKKGSGAPSTVADIAADPSKGMSGKSDFDDDWEDDDLLNDSFVLEMTQNPAALDGASARRSAAAPAPPSHLPGSKAGDPVIKANPSVSARMAACGQAGPSGSRGGGSGGSTTGVASEPRSTKPGTSAKPSTFMPEPSGHSLSKNTTSGGPRKPCLNAADARTHEHSRVHSSSREQQEAQTVAPASTSKHQTAGSDSLNCAQKSSKGIPNKALKSQAVSGDAWGDEGDEDDDLLYQVCDVVERISSSQEEARASTGGSKPVPSCTRQLSLQSDGVPAQTHTVVTGSWPPAQTSSVGNRRPPYSFARSLSMPNNSTTTTAAVSANRVQASGFSAGPSVQNRHAAAAAASVSHGPNQYKFTQLKNPPVHTQNRQGPANPQGPRGPNPTNAYQLTHKRHLQEPRPLANKVFVPNQRPVKCSAAEIERKKQEAIARRKLRMEASQNPSMLT